MSVPAAKLDEIPDGGVIRRTIEGREIALVRKGGEVFALDAVCPHRGGPLDSGDLDGMVLTCPWHGWRFDIRTGKSATHPGQVFCHKVEIRDGEIYVSVAR